MINSFLLRVIIIEQKRFETSILDINLTADLDLQFQSEVNIKDVTNVYNNIYKDRHANQSSVYEDDYALLQLFSTLPVVELHDFHEK